MTVTEPKMKERRRSPRNPAQQSLSYTVLGAPVPITGSGTMVNMSRSGLLFRAERNLAPGTNLELSIVWPTKNRPALPLSVAVRGQVLRSQDGCAAVKIIRGRSQGSVRSVISFQQAA